MIRPKARAADGSWHDSKLFEDLNGKYGRAKATDAYLMTKGAGFDAFFERVGPGGETLSPPSVEARTKVACDELGEPLMRELERQDDFKAVLDIPGRSATAAARLNGGGPKEATRKAIDDADARAERYNEGEGREDGRVALADTAVAGADGREYVVVRVVEADDTSRNMAVDAMGKRRLNDRLRGILSSWGIGVGALTKVEKAMRVRGATDFGAVRRTAEGLVEMIRLAKGRAGDEALPEEFAHIAVEAMKDSPLIGRLYSTIKGKGLARAILGDAEYEAYKERYRTAHMDADERSFWRSMRGVLTGDPDARMSKEEDVEAQVIYEAIGKMVADKILMSFGLHGRTSYGEADDAMRRLSAYYTERFGAFDEDEIYRALVELDRGASEFARFVTGDDAFSAETRRKVRSIASRETFYQLDDRIGKQRELLDKLVENSIRRAKVLSARDGREDAASGSYQVRLLQKDYDDAQYELGIYKFAGDALERLEQLDAELVDLSGKDVPLHIKTKRLRKVKDFIHSYRQGIELIDEARYNGVLEMPQDTLDVLTKCSDLVRKLVANYKAVSDPLFVKWITTFMGDSVTVPFGRMKGQEIKASELAEEGLADISMMDRWLDSMAESGDWVLRMLDAQTKKARMQARGKVLAIKEEIDAAYARLRNAGVKDFGFMHKRTADGHITGEYLSMEEAKSLPAAQREFHKAFMDIKRKCDNLLPDGSTHLTNMIRIRKDLVERLGGRTAKGKLHEVMESIRDDFVRRSDDAEFGGEKTALVDFEGHQVERLPIYYIKSKEGEDLDDLSTDACSSLLMYADMCCNYASMNNVIGTLEMVRDKMRERPVRRTHGDRPLTNVISAFGSTVRRHLTDEGDTTNAVARMDDWFESQVYGRYMKDEGEVLGIDKGKAANFLNFMTSLNQFALNIMSGISNVMTGSAMMHIEHAAGEFFTARDTMHADATFWRQMKDYIGDVNNPVKRSKLALFNMKFNSLINYEETVRGMEYGRSRASRFLGSDSLYFLNSCGELWLQSRCALSLAYATKLSLGGREVSLWDAYEVVEEGGVAVLRLRDGVTNADGTEFTEDDEQKFTTRAKAINQRMNGIYNYEDRCAAQAYGIGRLALMFRKWMKTSLNRRYGKVRYNYDLQSWEEGYYRTAGRFVAGLWSDLRMGTLNVALRWSELDDTERANMKRAAGDVAMLMVVTLMFALLTSLKYKDGGGDDDDYTDTWAFDMLRYQVRRLEAELGAMAPTPMIFDEAFNILKSPAACIQPMEGAVNLLKILWPMNHFKKIQSGKYAGRSKAYKYFMDSPLVPIWRTVYRGLHPENSIGFFEQD